MGRLGALVAAAMPDPMTVSVYDGKDPAQQRAAHRQVALIHEQQRTNALLGELIALQREALDANRAR